MINEHFFRVRCIECAILIIRSTIHLIIIVWIRITIHIWGHSHLLFKPCCHSNTLRLTRITQTQFLSLLFEKLLAKWSWIHIIPNLFIPGSSARTYCIFYNVLFCIYTSSINYFFFGRRSIYLRYLLPRKPSFFLIYIALKLFLLFYAEVHLWPSMIWTFF